jgi:hypothetical protein
MTGLRVTIGVLGVAGFVAGLLIDRPAVLAPLFAFGVVAFILAAGCLAADLLPLRPVYAATSGLALVDAVVMTLAGQASRLLALAAALGLVLLSAAPRLTRLGG